MEPIERAGERPPRTVERGAGSDSTRALRDVGSEIEPLLALFPDTTRLADDGSLVVGGCRLEDVAEEFGTPVYVVDEQSLRQQARRYREGLVSRRPGSQVAFASKSFPCRAVYRLMADEGLLVDVAGAGELRMALSAGVDPASIVLHGNAKTDAELALAIDSGVGRVVIDAVDEIGRLDRMAQRGQTVLLRVQPGIDPRTHSGIATGQRGSKFGVPLEGVPDALARIGASRSLHLEGLHVHLGSQMLHLEPFSRAVEVIAGLGRFDVYDLGGGLGVRYRRDGSAPGVDRYLDVVTQAARRHLPDEARIVLEPGRSLVARSTVTVYRVVTVKAGEPTFVAVDGGLADNFEASIYMGQHFDATLVGRVGGGEPVELVGRQCESGDRLSSQVPLRDPRPGDLVAMPMTGAYTHTLANHYNGALRPAVVFCRDGAARAVVRRDTYDDLLARELPWP
jgi:diaminopimelate decarboxylase